MKKKDEHLITGERKTHSSFAVTEAADNDNDITPQERELLNRSSEDEEERHAHRAELDDRDDDGELLNESTSADDNTGRDLDVPGSEEDDDNEDIGEEDEENNSYSLGGDRYD